MVHIGLVDTEWNLCKWQIRGSMHVAESFSAGFRDRHARQGMLLRRAFARSMSALIGGQEVCMVLWFNSGHTLE